MGVKPLESRRRVRQVNILKVEKKEANVTDLGVDSELKLEKE